MKTLLTIAGFDPSSGAGISADLQVFAAHGHFGTACITALTVQNTLGVFSVHPTPSETITSTLDRLCEDLPPAGIKIGMLPTPASITATAAFLKRVRSERPTVVVLDPVLKSSSGHGLADPCGAESIRQELLPFVDFITPNTDELAALVGRESIHPSQLLAAARELQQLSRGLTVVVTGGHLDPPDDLVVQAQCAPVLIPGEYIESSATHGTGCAYSSALLSRLILRADPVEAARSAKRYVASAIRSAESIGHGKGPLNLLWPLS